MTAGGMNVTSFPCFSRFRKLHVRGPGLIIEMYVMEGKKTCHHYRRKQVRVRCAMLSVLLDKRCSRVSPDCDTSEGTH